MTVSSRPAQPPAHADDITPLLELRDVTRSFQARRTSLLTPPPVTHALQRVSLQVMAGQRFGLVGESGSGKSTVLRLLAALDQPTDGTVWFDGMQVSGRRERHLGVLRDGLQIVFQDPMSSLNPRMRVRDIVVEPLVARGDARADRHARCDELLAAVGLDPDAADRWPHQFSGGQRQRIAIARALATNPRVLLADEPVSALDVSVRAQVLNLLQQLVDDLDLTLVFVSHDLTVVRHVCDHVAVMQDGRIVEQGPTAALVSSPTTDYTARLLAAVPTIQGGLAGRDAAALAAGATGGDRPRTADDG